jgi:hypothetical protein
MHNLIRNAYVKFLPTVFLVGVRVIGLSAMIVTQSAHAQSLGLIPSQRLIVNEPRPLLQLALREGEAFGILGGEFARFFAAHFNSTAPIEVDVKRIERLNTLKECAVLRVTTRQTGVVDRTTPFNATQPSTTNTPTNTAATPKPMQISYTVKWCSDGVLE